MFCPHHSVRKAAEVFDHHLSEHVRVRYNHNWSPAQVVPEIHKVKANNFKASLILPSMQILPSNVNSKCEKNEILL